MTEKSIEKALMRRAKRTGWHNRKFSAPGRRGVFDRIYFKMKVVVFIEMKQPGKDLSPLQVIEKRILDAEGIPNCVAHSVEEGMAFLDEHDPQKTKKEIKKKK